jgi:hypothetical protein
VVPDSPAFQKDFHVTVYNGLDSTLLEASQVKDSNSRCEYKQIQAEFRFFQQER